MKLREEIKHYRKEAVFENYTRIVEEFKDYDKISKPKMIDEIYKLYDNVDNILDICMETELKYLEMLVKGNKECQDRKKYSFEIHNLSHKYLILSYSKIEIPDEIFDKVCMALKKVNWNEVKKKDRINEVLVGICKVYGEIMAQPLLEVASFLLGVQKDLLSEHLVSNLVFKYYVYFDVEYHENLKVELPMFVYQDYFNFLDELKVARKKYGFAHTKEFCKEDFVNIFYYGFNINNGKVKKFYDVLMKNPYCSFIGDFVKETALLNGDRKVLAEFLKRFVGEDDNFFKLMDAALDEMPSGALNGATPNEAKYARLEKTKNDYRKEVQYIEQVNAKVSKKEAKTFYEIYFALLEFTNGKYEINPKLKKIYKQTKILPNELIGIIDKFWEEKDIIIEEFLKVNPYRFGNYEKNLVKGMKRGIRGTFILARHEREYTCLLSEDKCYMIKGLHDNLDAIISYRQLPCFVITSIMPFGEKIVFDGLLQSIPGISMGSNFESLVNEELESKERIYRL